MAESSLTAPHRLRLRNGGEITLRIIGPEWKTQLRDAFHKLSDASVQSRFFGAKSDLSDAELEELTRDDQRQRLGLIGVTDAGEIVASSRYVADEQGSAELAFAVLDDYQGQGIATAMLHCLCRLARENGLQGLHALVQDSNETMLNIFERAGFQVSNPDDEQIRTASYSLRDSAD